MLWVTTGFPPEISGPAVGNHDRARWFAAHGSFRVVVLAPRWPGTASTPATAEYPEVVRYPAKPWPPYRNFRVPTLAGARMVESQVRRLRPAVVLLTDIERSFLFASWRLPGRRWARRNGVPYLGYYHTDFYNFAGMYPVWRHLRDVLIRPALRRLYGSLDAAVCPSPSAARQADFLGARRSYALRFDGVDTDQFGPDRRDRQFLARLLGTDGSGPVVLSLGRLAWEKRVDLIIDAVGRLQRRPELADVRLVIAGAGADEVVAGLRRTAAGIPRPDRVHLVGPVTGTDKATLMASCDALCLASPYETFGITVTEAMASGLPVVASRSGALPDLLSHGRNSYLHVPEDAGSIADTLADALTTDRTPVVAQALEDVQHFSMHRVGADLDGFLTEIVRTRRLPDSQLEFTHGKSTVDAKGRE